MMLTSLMPVNVQFSLFFVRSFKLEGLNSPCIVMDLMIYHHIDVCRKERKRTNGDLNHRRDQRRENRSDEFCQIFRVSILFLRWIIGCKTFMDRWIVLIRREWDQFLDLTWPDVMAAKPQSFAKIRSELGWGSVPVTAPHNLIATYRTRTLWTSTLVDRRHSASFSVDSNFWLYVSGGMSYVTHKST